MIPARHTWLAVKFFRLYTDYRIKRNFPSVTVHGEVPDLHDKPLLVIANHFSWWDGFFILWLNNRFFKKRFHVMMLEDQLRKNMILNKTGAFSIKKRRRDMLESLLYARSILSAKDYVNGKPKIKTNLPMVLMYPQGKIQSMHTRPLRFEKGLEQITHGLEGKIHVLLVVVLIDYFSGQKPQLHFYLQLYPFNTSLLISDLEPAYNLFLSQSVQQQVTGLEH